jgi:hypothetical protein
MQQACVSQVVGQLLGVLATDAVVLKNLRQKRQKIQLPQEHKLVLGSGRICDQPLERRCALRVLGRLDQDAAVEQVLVALAQRGVDGTLACSFSAVDDVNLAVPHAAPLVGLDEVGAELSSLFLRDALTER